jgi:hypothetical protein
MRSFRIARKPVLLAAATTNMARRRGQRLRCGVPHGHYKAITFVFGLRCERVSPPIGSGA